MNKKHLFYAALITGATAALTVAVALTLNFSRGKSTPPLSPAVEAPLLAQTVRLTNESKSGPVEGIKVHGHWTIDVRNPDGRLVTHREFENALVPQGALLLSSLLSRQSATGLWAIYLRATTSSPWVASSSGRIHEPGDNIADHEYNSKTLKIRTSDSLANPTVILSGNITAERNGVIDQVETVLGVCDGTVAAGSCLRGAFTGGGLFTSVALFTPASANDPCPPNTQCSVSVVTGQIIQVSVVFRFS